MGLSTTDLEYLRRFARSPDGRQWLDILQRNLAETDVKLRTTIGDDLLRTQGRAQLLAELIDQVTKAEAVLARATPRRLVAEPSGQAGKSSAPWQA
jgi:broad specificity phosphatase PhoE